MRAKNTSPRRWEGEPPLARIFKRERRVICDIKKEYMLARNLGRNITLRPDHSVIQIRNLQDNTVRAPQI